MQLDARIKYEGLTQKDLHLSFGSRDLYCHFLALYRHRPWSTISCIDHAVGSRSLLWHRPLINVILDKAAKKFAVSIYERAIVSSHIHLLIRAKNRTQLENFFRVAACHVAQEILGTFPIAFGEKPSVAGGAPSAAKAIKKVA